MYAGSPGSVQPQSPYRHALQHSPPDQVGGMQQMASSPHQAVGQNHPTAYSPYTGMTKAVQNTTGYPTSKMHTWNVTHFFKFWYYLGNHSIIPPIL